jgi:SAM-dependent methyltransferase
MNLSAGRIRWQRWLFMSPVDIGLFVQSARTDARIASLRAAVGARAAFENAYAGGADPWASADRRYFYQRRKYEALIGLLPQGRRFARVLDLGSGTGTLSLSLTPVADTVLGIDIAQSAVDAATARAAGRPGLCFRQGDIASLDPGLDGGFDLVVVADTIYYLDRVDDLTLKNLAVRIARLLAPGGICLIANHYFFAGDRESRLSRRIHDAFIWSPAFAHLSTHRRPFFLASLLTTPVTQADQPAPA